MKTKTRPHTKSAHVFFKKKFMNKSFVKAYEEASSLMNVAFAIVEARNRARLSQVDLAQKLKTTQSVISRIENGNQNLSLKMLAKIAQVLSCDLSVQFKPQKLAA